MTCIELRQRCGHAYRIAYELPRALRTEAHGWPRAEWPWLARIVCRHGHVGVQGGEWLYAFSDRRLIAGRLRRLPCLERVQGDAEVRVVFHVEHLEAVLAILRPYRRRRVSERERERLRAIGTPHRFGDRHGVQSERWAPGSTQTPGERQGDTPDPPSDPRLGKAT